MQRVIHSAVPAVPAVPDASRSGVRLRVAAGPDSGREWRLPSGRFVIGRAASCGLVLADPAAESTHALVEVGADGSVAIVQLAGRVPIQRDGPVIQLADSRLELDRAGATCDGAGDGVLGVCEAGAGLGGAGRANGTTEGLRARLPDRAPSVVALVDPEPGAGRAVALIRSLVAQRIVGLASPAVVVRLRQALGIEDLIAVHTSRATPADVLVIDSAGLSDGDASLDEVVADHRAALTLLVTRDRRSPNVAACDSIVEFGCRWRARWVPDVNEPTRIERIHVAGWSIATARAILTRAERDRRSGGRLRSAETSGAGPLIAEQVAGPAAERGGDVVAVPQPATGER
jgi:hypothetical protein